jgi:hypothetical protein
LVKAKYNNILAFKDLLHGKKRGDIMKGLNRLSVIFLVLSLILWIPLTAMGDIPENLRFDPLPQPGDTMVSGICDQTGYCFGELGAFLAIGEDPAGWPIIGKGLCVDGRFTINLIQPTDGSLDKNPTTLPYALKAGDVVGVGQWVEVVYDEPPCDETPLFTVGRVGIPAIAPWGVVILSILLAVSAVVLIKRRRRA